MSEPSLVPHVAASTGEVPAGKPAEPDSPEFEASDRCFRCDYDLRGIVDDQPCPECGLLAERSRRKSDHLSDASPAWMARVSVGLGLILLCMIALPIYVIPALGVMNRATLFRNRATQAAIDQQVTLAGCTIIALLFWFGVRLFTRPEPRITDDDSKNRRARLRRIALLPVIALLLLHSAWGLRWLFPEVARFEYANWWQLRNQQFNPTPARMVWLACIPIGMMLIAILARRPAWRTASIALLVSTIPLISIAWYSTHHVLQNEWDWRYHVAGIRSGPNVSANRASPAPWYLVPQWAFMRYGPWLAGLLLTLGCCPMPVMLFYYLRWLARRALNSRLAEHCAIVAFGSAGLLLLYPAQSVFFRLADHSLGEAWARRGISSMAVIATGLSLAILFYGWAVVTLARGTKEFAKAAARRRREWRAADRSLAEG